MRFEPISDNSKQIINYMRTLINKGETEHLKEDENGWLYGGRTFTETVASLQKGMKEELKSQNVRVGYRCTVLMHNF